MYFFRRVYIYILLYPKYLGSRHSFLVKTDSVIIIKLFVVCRLFNSQSQLFKGKCQDNAFHVLYSLIIKVAEEPALC